MPVFIANTQTDMQKVWIVFSLAVLAGLGGYWFYRQNQIAAPPVAAVTLDSTATAKPKPGKGKKKKPFVNLHIDSIAVHKNSRELFAFSNGNIVLHYNVALGPNPVGPKEVEGDNKTPEGLYKIDGKNPFSQYHKSLGISYPNTADKERARELGQKTGGDIKIHGLMKRMNNPGKSHIKSNWTAGCIAITNEEIDELFAQVKVGTPIFIAP